MVGYQVYRNDEHVATVSGCYYADTGLTPNTAYRYKVFSVDGMGFVSQSGTDSVLAEVRTSIQPSPLTVRIVRPLPDAVLSGVSELEVQVDSGSGNVHHIVMTTIDGDLFGGDNSPMPYVRRLFTANWMNGTHILRVYAADDTGAAGYAEVAFTTMNSPEAPDPAVALPASPERRLVEPAWREEGGIM